MSRTKRFLTAGLITFVLLLAVAGGAVYFLFFNPPGTTSNDEDHFVEIEPGTSTRAIANKLAQDGVIRSPWGFLVLRALHPRAKLQAGEYQFSGTPTLWQVFEKIRLGQVYYEEITIPEGSNRFDIAAVLEKSETVTPDDFLAAAKDAAGIHDLDPAAPSLEGYLFPSTYRLTAKSTAKDLCRMMTTEFRRQWAELHPPAGADVHRVVTLASLVEKETAVPLERPLVAAVFTNRLALHMPLQCDPTTVYAALLDNRYRGVIHKSDLASTNAYNTYAHIGLPPGPIANPGALSLKAALHPATSDFLYFVAKGDGSGHHNFSRTLTEHKTAVSNFRKTAH